MSNLRKIKLNVMDLGRLMEDAPPEDVRQVLEDLTYEAAMNSKAKVLNILSYNSEYKFELKEKILRRDCLELTYRYE
jgi:hypothetical protein